MANQRLRFRKNLQQTYCAFCRVPRWIKKNYQLRWHHWLSITLSSAALMYCFWLELHPGFVVLFIGGLTLFDLLARVQWRMQLSCPHCGFDPVLYKRNPAQACQKVKIRLDERKNDPQAMLSKNSRLNIPIKRKKRDGSFEIYQ